jgi:cbb3-type cytochrome oxidase maturation protein
MSALFVLVSISILIAGSFLGAFIWCVSTDQYEDRHGAAMRMLYDDDIQKDATTKKSKHTI